MDLPARTKKLLVEYANTMRQLRDEGIVTSSNNPVADVAEWVACQALVLTRAPRNTKSYDAVDGYGKKYEIKSRRITRENKSRRTSAIRNLDKKLFDYLVMVIFTENFDVEGIWVMPHDVVSDIAQFQAHTNSHFINFTGTKLNDARIRRI